jgi:type I restriction enzyme S subunit
MSAAWPTVAIGSVLTERCETPPDHELVSGALRIVDKVSFNDGRIHLRQTQETKTGMILVRPGDILVSGINAAKGAIAIYDSQASNPIAATIHYGAYSADHSRAFPRFLWWLLRSNVFRDLLAKHVPGGIKTELKSKRLLPIPIPLPPIEEQRRIVARIEHFAAKVEEARSLRETANDEAAALVSAHLGAMFRTLADHYPVHPLGELSSHIVDGPHQTPSYLPDKSGVPFVTVRNMVTGKLSFDNLNYVSIEDHREFTKRCRAVRGDVLYSKDGATKGRPCYIDTDDEFSFFVSVALIKPLRGRLDARFLVHLLNSSWIKDRMIDKSRGDMIPHIVLREIRAFPVPLPSLDKQREIVAKLDVLQVKVDAMKALQEETAAELNAMLPAILDKAFKGEL